MATKKAKSVSKGTMLNFLYGLKCDINWSLKGAMEADASDEFIGTLKDESAAVDALIRLVKENVPND